MGTATDRTDQDWTLLHHFCFTFTCCTVIAGFGCVKDLQKKVNLDFWSALENKTLEPCNLEGKQPPLLAAHWPQSHYWDFQNADEMALAKILSTRMEMYILVYLMECNIFLQRGLGCVSLLSCYGNTSPTQRIPCNFIPQYLMFLLAMFSLPHLLRTTRPFLGYNPQRSHVEFIYVSFSNQPRRNFRWEELYLL